MTEAEKNQRSIFTSILVPLLLLLISEIIIFASVIGASGVFSRLNQDNYDILHQQVQSRKDNLENYFVGTVGSLDSLAAQVNARTQELLDEGKIDLSSMDAGTGQTNELLSSLVDPLVSTMRDKRVNSIFIIINTHDLGNLYESGDFGKKPGIYIHDMDSTATPSLRNEDLVIKRGSTEIIESSSIASDIAWKPLFDFGNKQMADDYDFFWVPWQKAHETEGPKEASDFALWSASPSIGSDTDCNLAYTMPLILEDGTVYGVLGVDLSNRYLQSLLPYEEMTGGEEGAYVLGTIDQNEVDELSHVANVRAVAISSKTAGFADVDSTLNLSDYDSHEAVFNLGSDNYFADCEFLRLYNTNAPFEHKRVMLAGMVSEASLHRFSNRVLSMIGLAALLMLVAGVLGSLIIGRNLSRPIKQLADDVESATVKRAEMPYLTQTGITEVDSLTGAINSLSKDIASVKQLEQQRIEHERNYDMLTGVMNRRALYRQAEEVLERPEVAKHAAILLLDIDNMKKYNDSYGHYWGDKYIYQVARCLEDSVPEEVLIARDAGDEFFMLLYGYDSREEIEADIAALRNSIPHYSVLAPDGEAIPINISGGAAFYPEDSTRLTELMKLADYTMYQVKITGKNNIISFDLENYQEHSSVRQAVAELDELLHDYNKAEYHFQPIVNARTGDVYAYEALMRISMEHLKNPDDVVTLARQEGRLDGVEELTWKRAFECYDQLKRQLAVPADTPLFINSFASVVISNEVGKTLFNTYPDIASNLVIEITEAETMNDEAMEAKRAIPGFGGTFALDDYGSGYNSEIMLLELKPAYIKVDISIISHIDSSVDKQRIVENVLAYAHERGMFIVAEGVETASEMQTLMDLGVDLFQGYFLSRPARVPDPVSDEALKLIKGRDAE